VRSSVTQFVCICRKKEHQLHEQTIQDTKNHSINIFNNKHEYHTNPWATPARLRKARVTPTAVNLPAASSRSRVSGRDSVICSSSGVRIVAGILVTFLGRGTGRGGSGGWTSAMVASLCFWASAAISCHGRSFFCFLGLGGLDILVGDRCSRFVESRVRLQKIGMIAWRRMSSEHSALRSTPVNISPPNSITRSSYSKITPNSFSEGSYLTPNH
jgi:hypothetical protein